jgi:short-subunit dehydrogenase
MRAMTDILYMELKPFNINVMYIAPGSVRSNIASNQASRFRCVLCRFSFL